MKFTLSWLREHLDTTASLGEIRDRLTMLGLEVEGITNAAETLRGFVVGYVVEAVQHPNADRLRVCKVDTGNGVVQVVCGAPNARTGMKGVFAPSGSTIPGTGLLLKASKIRGEDSNGMLCSSRELELGDDHSGIIDLAAEAKTGAPAAEALGLDDPVIEIKVTPNRADCLGVHGIARDLAAAGLGTLKPVKADKIAGTYKSPIKWTHGYEPKPDSPCPIVVGRHFRGLKNGPSPDWLQRRLKAIGLRPISTLVDITNLVTFDLNRPLHVFDAKKLAGDLVMRQARDGEQILALDGKTYTLDPSVSVIADAKGVHGIGGIMGGEDTGVREDTTEMFLEAAYFTPIEHRRDRPQARHPVRRALSQRARHRSRILPVGRRSGDPPDPRTVRRRGERDRVERRHAALAAQLHLARRSREDADRHRRAARGDGGDPGQARLHRRRQRSVDGRGAVVAARHRRRGRPGRGSDARLGLRQDPDDVAAAPFGDVQAGARALQRRVPLARRALGARGMNEAVTWSFLPLKQAERFGGGGADLRLLNSIDADARHDAALDPAQPDRRRRGATRRAGLADPALFEVGPQYKDATPAGQRTVAAGMRHNMAVPRNWAGLPRTVDAFDAKADALAVLAAIGAPVDNMSAQAGAPDWYHPGRSGVIKLGDRVMAHFGELHPEIVAAADLKGPVAAFEVFLDAPPLPKAKATKARPKLVLSPFQPVERDFAFIVDAERRGREAGARRAQRRQGAGRPARACSTSMPARACPRARSRWRSPSPCSRSSARSPMRRSRRRVHKIVAQVAKATGAVLAWLGLALHRLPERSEASGPLRVHRVGRDARGPR